MKRLLFVFLLFYNLAFSQSPAGVWYFGREAGINFNIGNTPVALFDGKMRTYEGCATLCNDFGVLLFYTDGINVWNRNHQQMPNGSGLHGDPSSTQSAIIVPVPNSTTLYYIFTVDELAKSNGLKYSIVDMSLEDEYGDVTVKNVPILTPTAEKINVVRHANETDYWLVTHKFGNDEYYAYQVTPSGLGAPVISRVGETISGSVQNSLGYLKSSPDGKFIAAANSKSSSSNVQLFDFNTSNGTLSLISTSVFPGGITGLGVYGLEFSNDSNLLYVTNINYGTNKSQLYQFSIQSKNETIINSSKILITEFQSDNLSNGTLGALQLAPNKKIYVARNNSNYVSVINNPDVSGLGCLFDDAGFSLGSKICYYGLPAFITSLFNVSYRYSNICMGNTTQFEIPQINNILSVDWDFGDSLSPFNVSNLENPSHVFTAPGVYAVKVTVRTATSTKTYTRNVKIIATPIANKPSNMLSCSQNNDADFKLSERTLQVLGAQSSLDYKVSYFLTYDNAFDNEFPLDQDQYNSTGNLQTIYARIQPINSDQCFDITDFNLIVNKNPELEPDGTAFYCLNTYPARISLKAGNLNPGVSLNYVWSTGAITETIQINESGVYTVEATDSNGCSSMRTITVSDSEIASVAYTIEGNVGNYSLVVNATGIGGSYTYSLDDEFGIYQASNVFHNISSGEHTVYVKDTNRCGTASVVFSVIGYSNFFTPNGDGINERWNLTGMQQNVKEISIFDRYGKLIYSMKPNSNGWDGTYNGKKMPASDYWFYAKLEDGKEIKGHFSLKR